MQTAARLAAHVGESVRWLLRAAPEGRTARWWAVVSAALSPVLLIGGWLAADVLAPVGYNPLQQSISVLAGYAGTHRWIVTAALLAGGLLHAVTAAGLHGLRPAARLALVVAGAAAVGVAACPEPVHGSTAQHMAFTVLGAIVIAIWPALVGTRRHRHSFVLSVRGSLAVTGVFLALLAWLTVETHVGGMLGLAERVVTSVQITWPFVVAFAAWRSRDRFAAAVERAQLGTRAIGTPGR